MDGNPENTRNRLVKYHAARLLRHFEATMGTVRKQLEPELIGFMSALAAEGERSAVVLGAERINVALEMLLKKFLRPPTNKEDTLFSNEGALATFSRKIEIAYRLGLISSDFKEALGIVRKLRNDFAHATKVETLRERPHADRIRALRKIATQAEDYKSILQGFQHVHEEARVYLACIIAMLVELALVTHYTERPIVILKAYVDTNRAGD